MRLLIMAIGVYTFMVCIELFDGEKESKWFLILTMLMLATTCLIYFVTLKQ